MYSFLVPHSSFLIPKTISMNSLLITTQLSSFQVQPIFLPQSHTRKSFNLFLRMKHPTFHPFVLFSSFSSSNGSNLSSSDEPIILRTQVGTPKLPSFPSPFPNLTFNDQAFFLLAFIASTTSVAFASLVFTAVPTLLAMRNAAISLSKLADTARQELPSTMAAIRLSGMEISDLTLELSDLSHEIADGVNKSTQALQSAEAGIRKISSMAQQQTISMIEERASLPVISLQPVVVGAAKKTSRAVGRATKSLMNIISGREEGTEE
ncbi:hypothetical protein Lalb_Chr03g0024371 [Lupinus albus]|uniref:Transmembrane protein n=1 Tax=Lupinus albus TaxID=3870 RepID=A0A6A4QS46_LUPAL|nr:hypothetical protein Lalb_Chr03g0024371 [Lupinus albus]